MQESKGLIFKWKPSDGLFIDRTAAVYKGDTQIRGLTNEGD